MKDEILDASQTNTLEGGGLASRFRTDFIGLPGPQHGKCLRRGRRLACMGGDDTFCVYLAQRSRRRRGFIPARGFGRPSIWKLASSRASGLRSKSIPWRKSHSLHTRLPPKGAYLRRNSRYRGRELPAEGAADRNRFSRVDRCRSLCRPGSSCRRRSRAWRKRLCFS